MYYINLIVKRLLCSATNKNNTAPALLPQLLSLLLLLLLLLVLLLLLLLLLYYYYYYYCYYCYCNYYYDDIDDDNDEYRQWRIWGLGHLRLFLVLGQLVWPLCVLAILARENVPPPYGILNAPLTIVLRIVIATMT